VKTIDKKTTLAVLVDGSLLGCETEFDPPSHVNSLRVLAVQADSPFAAPGQTVQLRALSHDPSMRPINWAWGVCENPKAATVEACVERFVEVSRQDGTPPILAMGEGQDSAELTVASDALDVLPSEARSQAMVGVLSVACPGELELDTSAGDWPFRCTDSATGRAMDLDEYVMGMKRVYVRASDTNENPVIQQVLFDGEVWPEEEVKDVDSCDADDFDFESCDEGAAHRLAAIVDTASFESGRDEFGRDFSEQLVIQHYATEGIFEGEVRIADEPETGWVARRRASGSELTLWFVARDNRGGVSWTKRRVQVR